MIRLFLRTCAPIALVISVPAMAAPSVATLPQIVPQPAAMTLAGGNLTIGKTATIVVIGQEDREVLRLTKEALASLGVEHIRTARRLPKVVSETHVVLGAGDAQALAAALSTAGGTLPTAHEGYALASTATDNGAALIVLAGKDADGLYYAGQTLKQVARRGTLPALRIADQPRMAVRGTIEGFYGAPWSPQDRLAHIAFLGSVKANTYIYSPKDDPFARDRWRDPYPAETLAGLRELVDAARAQHVRFTYAISPGPSICYSDPADLAALKRKFTAFSTLGVRSFYIAYDDIAYDKWNCDADRAALGEPGKEAAGRAQAQLTNVIMEWLAKRDGDEAELMIVPTEYYDAIESPYKAALRAVDPRVFVQWTGTDVVPPSIGIRDAKAATKAFGRKTLLWDNYPVNDYGESTGRLLMAPYDRREPGLSDELSGILANPMNQEAPSRIAVTGSIAFSWNDRDYDPQRTWIWATRELASGDEPTAQALLMLFDLEHLAPTFGSQPWQPQAPALARVLDGVTDALTNGSPQARSDALRNLGALADRMTTAPATIRAGVHDKGFLAQSAPWLEAMGHWGKALQATTAGLTAALSADPTSAARFSEAAQEVQAASAISTIAGTTRPQGKIQMGDGVLDRFIRAAPLLIAGHQPTPE